MIITLFFIVSIIASWIGFYAFNEEILEEIYSKSVYYFLSASVVLWLFSISNIFRYFKIRIKDFICSIVQFVIKHKIAILLSAFLIILGMFICKPDYRILADETNLISDSQVLYEKKECYIEVTSLNFGIGHKEVTKKLIDKRPALFPYLLFLIHSILSYSTENAFLLNGLVGFLTLFLFYYIIQLFYGKYWGICGLISFSAYPLFLLYTNSAGFDVFNILCSFVFFINAYYFIKNPNAGIAEVLLFWLPIISQSRYESAVTVFIALPLVLCLLPKVEYSKLSYRILFFPLLFIPIAWVRILTNNADSWQLKSMDNCFSIDNFCNNFKQALVFFFSGKEEYGIISIISWLGLLGVIAFVGKRIYRKYNKSKLNEEISPKLSLSFIFIIVVFYLLHCIIKFSYSLCDLTNEYISRLGLIFVPVFIVGMIELLHEIGKRNFYIKLSLSIMIFSLPFIYWPNAARYCGINDLYIEFKNARDFLSKNYPNKADYIILSDRPNLFVPFGYNSMGLEDLTYDKERMLNFYYKNYCSYFIAIQDVYYETNQIADDYGLPDDLSGNVIYEKQTRPGIVQRFSIIKPDK